MSVSIIDKYVSKKKKDLLEYAKILESIVSLDDNKLWSNKKDFITLAESIISLYVDSYYFDNNDNRDNPVLYSNDNINFVLKSIIEYFKSKNTVNLIHERKNETFLLSVIICTACYLDFATNVVDGDYNDTKAKFKYLLDYFRKTKILVVSDNKYWIKDLFELIKKINNIDRKFLDSFNIDNMYNKYISYKNNSSYYTFDFNYTIEENKDKDDLLVKKVAKKYEAKLNEISYELLIVHILKEYISNKEMKISLIKVNNILNKKNNLVYMFDNKYLKPFIKLLIPFEEESSYLEAIKSFKEIGIDTIYDYSGVEHVDDRIFDNDMKVFVKQEFLNNNQDNKLMWDKKNVEFIIVSEEY